MVDEKFNEKEMEKQEEKWHRDPISSLIGALLLIWAGVVLLAGNLGYLNVFTDFLNRLPIRSYELPFDPPFVDLGAWQVFFLGAGAILLFEIVVRLLVPAYRRQVFGSFIGAIVFFGLGLGNWTIIWPLILVAAGLSILLGGLVRRR